MEEVISNDPLNFISHDEGNYDVDRMDYLLRDYLYKGDFFDNYTHEQYEKIDVCIDENGDVVKGPDGNLLLASDNKDGKYLTKKIDIYPFSSLKQIEAFLERRVQAYKDMYFSETTQVSDYFEGNFINRVAEDKKNYGKAEELKQFIYDLRKYGVDIDLNEFLKWDDIRFYDCCIDVGELSDDENLRAYAGMIIPQLQALMNLTYSHLDLKNAKEKGFKNIAEEDKAFIKRIKALIESNEGMGRILKTPNYYKNNCLISSDTNKINEIKKNFGDKVFYANATVYGYKDKVPVYIKNEDGGVYDLDEHPNRNCDWDERKEKISVAFCAIPQLKLHGLKNEEINEIKSMFTGQSNPSVDEKSKCNQIRPRNSMDRYFDI